MDHAGTSGARFGRRTIFGHFGGAPARIRSLIQELFRDLGFDVGALPGIEYAVNELLLFAGPNDPHAQYWSTAPQANPPTTLTSAQVAIDYLSGVAKSWRATH